MNTIEYMWWGRKWSDGTDAYDYVTEKITEATNEFVQEGWDIVDWKFSTDHWLMILFSRDKAVWAEKQLGDG